MGSTSHPKNYSADCCRQCDASVSRKRRDLEANTLRLMPKTRAAVCRPRPIKGHKMTKLREAEIAKAVENYLFDAGGKASIAQIRRNLPFYITLTDSDRKPSTTRPGEQMWEQQVRNIVCHRDSLGNAINSGKLNYTPRHLSLAIGPQGELRL